MPGNVAARLHQVRGWTPEAIVRLGLGYDGERVTIPVRDQSGTLLGHTRYLPNAAEGTPKMLADRGKPREPYRPLHEGSARAGRRGQIHNAPSRREGCLALACGRL